MFSVFSELGGVWGAFFVRGVSGGTLAGELVGVKGFWGELLGDWRGNYWKEIDPETAVCRLRKATARLGETAAPCGCRNGGLETAAPCLMPGGKVKRSERRHRHERALPAGRRFH